ncbi:MAG: hypothetical protein ABGZ17_21435 [Planctomycetaceae bacterium]
MRTDDGKPLTKNPNGGQRLPREIRELVIQIARLTAFGDTRTVGKLRKATRVVDV